MFPFLAVLVCTMGALIVLLVVITRQSRLAAAEAAAEQRREQQADLQAAQEMAEWRVEQLRDSERQTDEQLEQARAMLGNLEEHARQLHNELEQIREAWEGMKAAGEHRRERREHLEAELARLQTQIERAREQLADAERAVADREPRYAIIPYEGPNQTRRQPIYLECTGEAVILWPEGIRFPAEDFEGPLGPGNPLAAAVRAKREYLLDHQAYDPSRRGEPYPLMIVRPDGVASYVAAREALTSWKDSFGYELVPEDWKFEYPPSDTGLKAELERAIAVARQRQRLVAAAAPRHRRAIEGGHGGRVVYRAAPGGGVMVEGTPPDLQHSRPTRSGRGRSRQGHGFGEGGVGRGEGGAGRGAGGTGRSGEDAAGEGASRELAAGEARGRGSRGNGHGDSTFPSHWTEDPNSAHGEADSPSATDEQLAGIYGDPLAEGGPGDEAADVAAKRSDSRGGIPGNTDDADGWRRDRGRLGESWPAEARPEGMIADRSDRGTGSHSAGRDGQDGQPGQASQAGQTGGIPGAPMAGSAPSGEPALALRPGEWHDAQQLSSLADHKGHDWALRGSTPRATPITRPIRVKCYRDRLVIAAQPGGAGEQVIPFNGPPVDAAEKLVDAVWNVLDGWGIAGRGMYWKPILKFQVAAGAEHRLTQLQQLLDGSGLIIEADM